MRHEGFATTLLLSVVAVFVGATGCNGDRAAPSPKATSATTAGGSVSAQTIRLDTDTVSGCAHGSAALATSSRKRLSATTAVR